MRSRFFRMKILIVSLKCLIGNLPGCGAPRMVTILIKMGKYLLLVCFLAGYSFTAIAQKPDTTSADIKSKTDSLVSTKSDTDVTRSFAPKQKKEKIYHPDSTHSPHKAVIRSLLIPGWGQVYNHRIWKVPVIYGVLGLLGWAVEFNNTYYNEFLAISKYREHGTMPGPKDPYYAEYQLYASQPNQALYSATDAYRRNRDLSILGIVGFWGINAVDAYIDAKFIHSYTVDSKLSIKVTPQLINQPMYAQNSIGGYIPATKITFALR